MTTTETRVVQLDFENDNFIKGIEDSLISIEDFERSIDMEDVEDAFDGISKAADAVDISGIETQLANLSDHFSAMGVSAMTTIAQITSKLNSTLASSVSSVFNSVFSGGVNRTLNLQQAQFTLEGLLDTDAEVEEVMNNVSDAVSGTAYSLDAAAGVASQLVASGVEGGEEMTTILQGIAGTAAMTGSEYSDIGNIFTTVAGNGRLMADQLNQLSTKGLNAAATIADYLGTTEAEVRDMVSNSEISFDIFAAAMSSAFGEHAKAANKTFTGVCSNIKSALSRIGELYVSDLLKNEGPIVKFLNVVIDRINDVNTKLGDSATMFVKFAKSVIKWGKNFLENFNLAKPFKVFYNVLDGLVNLVMKSLWPSIKKIGEAFGEVFDGEYGKSIVKISKKFKDFTADLKPTRSQLRQLETAFEGLWSVVDLAFEAVKAIVTPFTTLNGSLLPSLIQVVLNFAEGVGELLIQFHDFVVESQFFEFVTAALSTCLSYLQSILAIFLDTLNSMLVKIGSMFSGIDSLSAVWDLLTGTISDSVEMFGGTDNALANLIQKLRDNTSAGSIFRNILDGITYALDDMTYAVQSVTDFISGMFSGFIDFLDAIGVTDVFVDIKDNVLDIFSTLAEELPGALQSGIDGIIAFLDGHEGEISNAFSKAFDVLKSEEFWNVLQEILKTGILARVMTLSQDLADTVEAVGEAVEKMGKAVSSIPAGMGAILNEVKDCMVSYQRQIRANNILKIAVAIAIIAASLYVLSTVPVPNLIAATVALAVLMATLVAMTNQLQKLAEAQGGELSKLEGLLAITVMFWGLSQAIARLGKMDTGQLVKGETAILVLMAAMTGIIAVINKTTPAGGLKLEGLAVTLLAIGVSLIPVCLMLKLMSTMEPETLATVCGHMVTLLLAFGVMIGVINKTASPNGTQLVGVASTVLAIGLALIPVCLMLKLMATMEPETLATVCGHMEILLLAFGVMIAVINASSCVGNAGVALANAVVMLTIGLAIIPICMALRVLATMPLDKMASATDLIKMIFTGLSVVIIVMSLCKPNVASALASAAVILSIGLAMIPICAALRVLATMPLAKLVTATVFMGVILFGIAAILTALSKMEGVLQQAIPAAASVLIVAIGMVPMAKAIALLAGYSIDQLVPAVVAMGLCLAEIVIVLEILARLGVLSVAAAVGAAGVLLVAMAMWPVAKSLAVLATLSWDGIMRGISAMGSALALLTGSSIMATFGVIGAGTIRTAAAGLVDLADAFERFGQMSSDASTRALQNMTDALGQLTETDFAKISSTGASALKTIAGPIGNLANSIKLWNGLTIADDWGESLEEAAEGLSSFNDLGEGLLNLDEDGATGIGILAESVQKWEGVELPENFGSNLQTLADGIIAFGTTGGENLATAAEPLGTLAESVMMWADLDFSGGGNLNTLPGNLAALGDGLKEFGAGFISGKQNYATNIENVGAALPNLASAVADWPYTSPTYALKGALENIASGMTYFSDKELGVDATKVSKNFKRIGNAMPNMATGISSFSSGVSLPEDFADQMSSVAEAVKAFASDGDTDFDSIAETITSLGTSFEAIGDSELDEIDYKAYANGLEKLMNALDSISISDVTYQNVMVMAEMLAYLVEGLGDDGADNIATIAKPMGTLATSLKKYEGIKFNVKQFKSMIKGIANAVKNNLTDTSLKQGIKNLKGIAKACNTLGKVKTIKYKNITTSLEKIVKCVNGLSLDTDVTSVADEIADAIDTISDAASDYQTAGKKLGKSVTQNISLGVANKKQVKACKDAVKTVAEKMVSTFQEEKVGKTIMKNLKTGITNNVSAPKTAAGTVAEDVVDELESFKSDFQSAGSNLMSGFAAGITKNSDEAETAAYDAGVAVVKALKKKALNEHSPSKVTQEVGEYFGAGLAIGIRETTSRVSNVASQLGYAAIDALNTSLDPSDSVLTVEQLFDISSLDSSLSDYTRRTSSSLGSLSTLMTSDAASMSLMTSNNDRLLSSNSDLRTNISELRSDMARYTSAIENRETAMYVDGKKLATTIAKPMNQQFATLSKRGKLSVR